MSGRSSCSCRSLTRPERASGKSWSYASIFKRLRKYLTIKVTVHTPTKKPISVVQANKMPRWSAKGNIRLWKFRKRMQNLNLKIKIILSLSVPCIYTSMIWILVRSYRNMANLWRRIGCLLVEEEAMSNSRVLISACPMANTLTRLSHWTPQRPWIRLKLWNKKRKMLPNQITSQEILTLKNWYWSRLQTITEPQEAAK